MCVCFQTLFCAFHLLLFCTYFPHSTSFSLTTATTSSLSFIWVSSILGKKPLKSVQVTNHAWTSIASYTRFERSKFEHIQVCSKATIRDIAFVEQVNSLDINGGKRDEYMGLGSENRKLGWGRGGAKLTINGGANVSFVMKAKTYCSGSSSKRSEWRLNSRNDGVKVIE